jgi:hypothetical protein
VTTACEDIRAAVRSHVLDEKNLRRQPPLTRIWDAEWHLQYVINNEYSGSYTWISNDTGPGRTEIPFNSPVAQWIHDHQGRISRGEGRNIGITVDYCGARWSGIMDKYTVEQRDDGDVVLVVDWMHDYEHLKWVTVWSNPWLPAVFQAPRAWVAAGPVPWILKHALLVNIIREHNPLITMVDDPLDLTSWFTDIDMSDWHIVVAPGSFLQAMASGAIWGVAFARWTNWHDMAHTMLEDAQQLVTCTRYLEGDDPPWAGANLRNGALVIDIVDKSGIYVGTSEGGTIFSGLQRTFWQFTDDFLDSTSEVIADIETPPDYFQPGYKFTHPAIPYVIFYEGDTSPIQTSQLINSPAKGVVIQCGGHSMPGVNEVISATIQAAFDMLGILVAISSLGTIVDTLLKPFYEDVILAWWSVKNHHRADNGGWERLNEYFQQGASKAFTIASLMVLRAGMWATRTVISWKVSVLDGQPYMIGDRGLGHFFLEDRVGLVLRGDTQIHMDRCRKLELSWDPDNPPEWHITIGDDRIWQDPAQRSWGKLEAMIAGLHDLGVW